MKPIDFPAEGPRLLNLGCGRTHHPRWLNLDLVSDSPQVVACDLTRGVPLAEASADAVYHSHVLEHLSPDQARGFLHECHRVLKPGGWLRVVVPDLEQIARLYLEQLEAAERGEVQAEFRHHWMTLELIDQMVRSQSGGEMGRFMSDCPPDQESFLRSRMGGEIQLAAGTSATPPVKHASPSGGAIQRRLTKWRDRFVRSLLKRLYDANALAAWDEARFRRSGEIHRWMYDRHSLARLLEAAGFVDIQVCGATQSHIEGFAADQLDSVGARIRKPDSLFIEARRPLKPATVADPTRRAA